MRITFLTGHLAKERHMLLFELAEDLSKYGADVTVITGFPSRRISESVRDYYIKHPIEQINEHFVVKRVGSKKGEGNGLFQRFLRYAKLVSVIKKEALKADTDCFYIYSSPPFLGYISKALSKKAPVVYNAQDIFPDSLFVLKPFVKKTIFGRYFEKKEKQAYNNATAIITISEAMKNTVSERCNNPSKISVVCNWSDYNSLHCVDRKSNKLFDDFNISRDKFIISYGGDIGLFQNWDAVIKVANSLRENNDILFVLFGNGSQLEYVKAEKERLDLSNLYILPMQPKDRVSEVYSFGDLELMSLSKGLTRFALPSKLYNIFACSKPVLAMLDSTSEYYSIINNQQMGYAVEPDDADGTIEAILDAYKNKDLSNKGKNGFNYLVNNCSRNIQTKLYYDIIDSLNRSK